ncbi:O-methyltransferase [Paenibacillus chartarius]|uniref:O-methyltransferase n=1 Tax=Paenibacillus chartarius TaxID=747481 RepID=A0ABV6DF41_9BACL
MHLDQLPLSKQVELVFRTMKEELSYLPSGTVFIQIRNNVVGKFGIRHNPLELEGDTIRPNGSGLTETQIQSFRNMAVEALKYKKWTHGEICYDFAVREGKLGASISFESNYNFSSLPEKFG